MIIIILPETMRSIAGDGTLRLSGIYRPLIWTVRKEPSYMVDPDERPELPKITWRTFVAPLTLLMNKSIVLSLIPGGIVYAIWSMVTASTVSLFKAKYQLNELLLGVAFIPNGMRSTSRLGTIVGSSIVGKLMNRDFIRTETEYKRSYNLPEYYELPKKDLPVDFPIERSRLRSIWGFMALFVFSTSIYGWTLAFPSFTAMPGSIALPLFFQFLIAASSNAVFAVNQTLIADLCPGKGASSTAINNLVRCTLGAIGVALIDQMIAATTVGPTFLGLGLISFICVPLLLIEWTSAMGWRVEEAARLTRDKVTIYYL
ncbi:hypothetical protein MMC10_007535 [Thelotrema lepadinum]|nr:hypothetical protein [Thelotrema lepadinum]